MANGTLDQIGGLLAQGSPLLDFGIGLLSQSGPSTTPTSFGQALGQAGQFMSERERARLQNQAIRQNLTQRQQRNQATSRLQGLMQERTPVVGPAGPEVTGLEGQTIGQVGGRAGLIPTMQTPEGQNEMIGLLGEIAPEAMVQGLLGQMFQSQEPPRGSTELNTFKRLFPELEEGTPEFAQRFQEFTNQVDPMQRLQLEQTLLELENARNEQERLEREQQVARQRARIGANSNLRSMLEAAESNRIMRDTFLQTGAIGAEGRRSLAAGVNEIRELFGEGDPQLSRVIQARDRFDQLTNQIVNNMATGEEGFGQLTNRKLEAIAGEKPSLQDSPTANAARLADMIEESLETYMTENVELDPQLVESAQAEIERLRQESQIAPEQEASATQTQQDDNGGRVVDFSDLPE